MAKLQESAKLGWKLYWCFGNILISKEAPQQRRVPYEGCSHHLDMLGPTRQQAVLRHLNWQPI